MHAFNVLTFFFSYIHATHLQLKKCVPGKNSLVIVHSHIAHYWVLKISATVNNSKVKLVCVF
jgi:hypothetical protein